MDHSKLLRSEEGSALVVAVLILCILTILGISANNSTTIDLQIAANDRDFVQEFYVADSAWKEAVYWLDDKVAAPEKVNPSSNADYTNSDKAVRNFGNGSVGTTNWNYPDDTEDGTIDGVNYWYNVVYESDEIEPGSGKSYRKFTYTTKSVADKSQAIEVKLTKVFKVGY